MATDLDALMTDLTEIHDELLDAERAPNQVKQLAEVAARVRKMYDAQGIKPSDRFLEIEAVIAQLAKSAQRGQDVGSQGKR
jgi:hypothetical protein